MIGPLSRIVLTAQPLDMALQQICELTKRVLPAVAEASVTVLQGGEPRTAVFTGTLAIDLDECQYQTGHGPCLDAAVTGNTINVDHTRPGSSPYPEFSEASTARRITHTTSIGLPSAASTIGALNLYLDTPQPLDTRGLALAETFAGHASIAITNTTGYHNTLDQAQQLSQALRSRALINQARGILMTQHDCTADEASTILIRTAQQQHRKLLDVATTLVAGT